MVGIIEYRQRLNALLADHTHALRQVREEKKALRDAKDHLATTAEAQRLVQEVAEAVQTQAHRQIASVVSRCLESVFEDDALPFRIVFERKRGKTEARLVFVRGDMEIDPTTADSGGMVDVAAFALRLACLALSRPQRRKIIVADEPFRFVNGREFQERVGSMILTLAKEFGVQFIFVSDDSWMRIGKVVDLEK